MKENIAGFKGLNDSDDSMMTPPEYVRVSRNVEVYRRKFKKVRAYTTDTNCLTGIMEAVINFMEFDTAFINAILMVTDSGCYVNQIQPQDLGAGDNYLVGSTDFTSHDATKALKIYTNDVAVVVNIGLNFTGNTTQVYREGYAVVDGELSQLGTYTVDIPVTTTLESQWVAYEMIGGDAILWYNIETESGSDIGYTTPPSYDWDSDSGGPDIINLDTTSYTSSGGLGGGIPVK